MQGKILANDGVELAYISYVPHEVNGCLIFYHGGGANREPYREMAQAICDTYHIAVFLFDVRGHGQSGGLRGHASAKEQVWTDVNHAIQFVKNLHRNCPIYLGGHSSGAGLLLNYSSWNLKEHVDSYLMIAPEFGYRIASQKMKFARLRRFVFLINKISNGYFCRKTLAVRFNYSSLEIKENGFVTGYTVNMAEAVTPDDPMDALINFDKPLSIILAGEDELINNDKLKEILSIVIKKNPNITLNVVPREKHIMILRNAHQYVADYFKKSKEN